MPGYASVTATVALGIALAAGVHSLATDDSDESPAPPATAPSTTAPEPETAERPAEGGATVIGPSTPVLLRTGRERVVLRRGPFSVEAHCLKAERGLTEIQLLAVTSASGAHVSSGRSTFLLRPRRPRLFLQLISRRTAVGAAPYALVVRGRRPLQGLMSFGVGMLGSDCFVAPVGLG